jgi:hypothetical protein
VSTYVHASGTGVLHKTGPPRGYVVHVISPLPSTPNLVNRALNN